MSNGFDFHALVSLCLQAHEQMQQQAAKTVNRLLVVRNWLIGRHIVEYEQQGSDRAKYGRRLIAALSECLRSQGLNGCSATNLKQCRTFYLSYKGIGQTASDLLPPTQTGQTPSDPLEVNPTPLPSGLPVDALLKRFSLGWSHYIALLSIDNPAERRFYEIEALAGGWGVRDLERQIASSLYERLALSRDKAEIRKLAEQGLAVEKATDLIKNPLVLEFLGLDERPAYSEHDLESAIIDKLETFLLELGKGFLFEARQRRFTFDNDHFYVDLVFYNRLLRCYVLIDLKRGKLTHQDLGQMQMYVNYFDRYVKLDDELPMIGILLCHRKQDALVELTLPKDANIFATKYQLYLPSKEELKAQLEKIEAELVKGGAWAVEIGK
ncbi:MAG: PDDEXK nuclease domain-containing protein [Chromatiaceae bacterium]